MHACCFICIFIYIYFFRGYFVCLLLFCSLRYHFLFGSCKSGVSFYFRFVKRVTLFNTVLGTISTRQWLSTTSILRIYVYMTVCVRVYVSANECEKERSDIDTRCEGEIGGRKSMFYFAICLNVRI